MPRMVGKACPAVTDLGSKLWEPLENWALRKLRLS